MKSWGRHMVLRGGIPRVMESAQQRACLWAGQATILVPPKHNNFEISTSFFCASSGDVSVFSDMAEYLSRHRPCPCVISMFPEAVVVDLTSRDRWI
jgi:hypothetical protein